MHRLYANENFPLPAVEELRRLGHDVLTSGDAGNAGRAVPDEEVLSFATGDARALVTLNRRHFIRLHESGRSHAGILVSSFDPNFKGLADRIHSAIAEETDLRGRLLRVNRGTAPGQG